MIEEYEFNPVGLSRKTVKELRAEYMNYKRRVQKQVAELQDVFPEAKALENVPSLPNYKKMKKKQLIYKLLQVESWASAPLSSVKGIRRNDAKVAAALAKQGLKIRPGDAKQFGEYMEKLRELGLDTMYDSRVLALSFARQRRRNKGVQNIINLDVSSVKSLGEKERNRLISGLQKTLVNIDVDEE